MIEQERLKKAFLHLLSGAENRTEQSCRYVLRSEFPLTIIKQYTNGTLYVEADTQGVLDQVTNLIDEMSGPPAGHFVRSGAATWIGTDECGKGDYFGPLTVAGVLLDAKSAQVLKKAGVRDSKDLDDSQIPSLAAAIRNVSDGRHAVFSCFPEAYNLDLSLPKYQGNSARLLGEMHANVISKLLETNDCDDIVIDKFGLEKHVLDFLPPVARKKNILFRHHAESNVAVAAASILAREAFLQGMDELSERVGVELPKGASLELEHVAAMLVAKQGEQILTGIAKLHFKTTIRVLAAARHL